MKYYAGLDVAMKETFLCIMNEEGQRIFESKSAIDIQAISEELAKSGVELEKIGLEAGSLSKYLTKGLQDLGLRAICIDARKMSAILKTTINKTDKNDARGIADAIRCNHYKEINLKGIENDTMSIFSHSRGPLVSNRVCLKNTVRGLLKTYGIRLGTVSHEKFPDRVREVLSEVPSEAKSGIEGLLVSFEVTHQEIKKLEKQLNELCKKDKAAQLLMTIPGVGMVVAMTYKADMGDPTRFEKSESVGAYYGMTPRQYSSGEIVKLGRISRSGSTEVRTLLRAAAMHILAHTKVWSSLKVWGLKIMKKHGFQKAAMAVGRKLAVIMHRMLVTGEAFKYSHKETQAA